ncbi:MAG: hypothetical protein ACRCSS_08025 [Shewanella sp.]
MKVTTQLTSKWLKGADVLAIVMCATGAVKAVGGDMPQALMLVMFGVVLNVVARILRWWWHG